MWALTLLPYADPVALRGRVLIRPCKGVGTDPVALRWGAHKTPADLIYTPGRLLMKTKNSIFESVISSRNILLSGRSSDDVRRCLTDVLQKNDVILVESTKKIFEICIQAAVLEVDRSNFNSAGVILNLIHNLPLDEADKACWDIDYFLSIELPTFLEHFDEIACSREIALCVFAQLAADYAKNSAVR